MLSKKFRLKQNSQFNYTFRKGVSTKVRFLVLLSAKHRESNVKVGIVVSKKIGNSVTRNRIKRLIREGIKPEINYLRSDLNLVFVARTGIENSNFQEVYLTIKELLKKSNAYIAK